MHQLREVHCSKCEQILLILLVIVLGFFFFVIFSVFIVVQRCGAHFVGSL